ncbi:MAG: permease [Clostridiales Family XIII bacterium]|jgi:uncharacterized membrane protein YraQ (UPF0718 family)|nr:permease [Clostridiales Family XIII bacterium]
MPIPVHVVTGFLDAGKTTFLNEFLQCPELRDAERAVFRFESGEATFSGARCADFPIPKRELDAQPDGVAERMGAILRERAVDEIWIEWNGMTPFAALQSLLAHPALRGLCKLGKVIYVADAAKLEALAGRTGSAPAEQMASCDFAVVRGVYTARGLKKFQRLLRAFNPGLRVHRAICQDDILKEFSGKKLSPWLRFLIPIVPAVALYLLAAPLLEPPVPLNKIVNIFLGIILQAIPFLIIGVLLSSVIRIFVSGAFIENRFPRHPALGMPAAILAGFCLPVCDCASIPIFRSLVEKGVPLPTAITFMTVTPVINPVVMLSTYYAFGGNMRFMLARVLLGVASAVLIGFTFALRPPKTPITSGGALAATMPCDCGCLEDAESVTGIGGKLGLLLRHAQAEFFDVGKYLVIGVFVSAVFQAFGAGAFASAQSGAGLAASMAVMMLMGFVLSLCSSSDAVVARSFASGFPPGALLGFLVFGPMMDIKNVLMLSSRFSKRFVARLTVCAFAICFATVFLFSFFGGVSL